MKGTFEGEHNREGELSELVLKRGAYLKREPIREGYFLRGGLIREGNEKDRKKMEGESHDKLRTTVQCNFFSLGQFFQGLILLLFFIFSMQVQMIPTCCKPCTT